MRIRILPLVLALALTVVVPAPALGAGQAPGPTSSLMIRAQPVATAKKVPARPPVLYQALKTQSMHSSASTASKKLVTAKKGSHLVHRKSKGSWVQVAHKGKTGWLKRASVRKLAQPVYEAKAKLSLRARPGSGKTVATLPMGKSGQATGRTSGSYIQLYVAGKTGWASSSKLQRPMTAKYQTGGATAFYPSATSKKRSATIPADYTMGTRTGRKSGGRLEAEYKGKTGWVAANKVTKVALGLKLGKLGFGQSAAKNIAKWCKGVPITAGRNLGDYAEASGWSGNMKESITLGTSDFFGGALDPNHPLAIATQYHECAHILQYRAYDYDFTRMAKDMNRVYGKPRTASGTEHMADCMADAMGATRTGFDAAGGYFWTSGYGGKCTSTHLKKAKLIIAGKRA
ncbi:hypothetical protein DQ353_18110 [Arthrobacter sp. AQ5-05]|uniref:SH3 domain-containing protein n=1 Tax=Arthrobacter sp. AQ5-05 TaxID=2184581 RepID=UPI000DCD9E86|nr:hypothetical protein [Arthrobacter sp. AQ5-05]RAX47897.1 hypothetical protein DQ353_18110 [Arthrobacter sp. AQ5-05]